MLELLPSAQRCASEDRPVLEVANLVKTYNGQDAVKGVSFTVQPGEAVAYLGPNGAGKSTTVKIIVGLLRATGGQVRVCGHDVEHQPVEAKRRLGYVPDHANLFQTLTANEYLSLVAELYHLPRALAAERIGQMSHALEIDTVANRPIETLSRGQRQKVLILGALIHDPDVILLDEPLNGLDVNAALTFRRVLEQLVARGKTVLFCSHILEVVERVCSRVIVLDRGQIIADAPTAELLSRTREGTLESVLRQLTGREVDEGAKSFMAALDKEGFKGAPSRVS